MANEVIYTVINETTLRRYPVLGKADAPLAMIWNAEKCWFSEGITVTISAPDGRKETFTK